LKTPEAVNRKTDNAMAKSTHTQRSTKQYTEN